VLNISAAPRVMLTVCKTRAVSVMEPGRGPLVLKNLFIHV
jgi:hypothetical protein